MENDFNTSRRGYSPLPTSQGAERTGEQSDASQTLGVNVGAHQIAFIEPPPLPPFMRQATDLFDSLWQRVTGPSSSDMLALSKTVQKLLVDMGAGAVPLAAMHHDLPLQTLCEMFCGDSPPVRFGKDDKGNVVFEICGQVDADKLKGIAEDLKRIGMPAQGRSLLATLNVAPDGDVGDLPAAVRDMLVKMGAGPEHLALAHDELPLQSLHQMFCGDRPPISIWRDDAGDVVFFSDPLVDTDAAVVIANRLARCGMTAQGASLLVSLVVRGHDLDPDARARLLKQLALLLWDRPEVQLPAMFLPKLRALMKDPALNQGLGTQCQDTLAQHLTEPSTNLSQEILPPQSHARRDMAPHLDLIDARLRKLPGNPLSRRAELDSIVSELVLMHDAAFNASSELMVNAVVDKLLEIRDGYACASAQSALDTCEQHRDEAAAYADRAETAPDLPSLMFGKGGVEVALEQAKALGPDQMLTALEAAIRCRGSLPAKVITAYIEHAKKLPNNPFTPSVERKLWVQHALASPELSREALTAWKETLARPGGALAELSSDEVAAVLSVCAGWADTGSTDDAEQALQLLDMLHERAGEGFVHNDSVLQATLRICASGKLTEPSLKKTVTTIALSPRARSLTPAMQVLLVESVLQLDPQWLSKRANYFAFLFPKGPNLLLAIIDAKERADFHRLSELLSQDCEPHTLRPIVRALILELVQRKEWNRIASWVPSLCISHRRGQPVYEWMTDIFLALTEHSETTRKTLMENLLPLLRRDHMMIAACLAAVAIATGDLAHARALLKGDARSTVYFLLCLRSNSLRHGDSHVAHDYMLQAIEHYTEQAANSQTFDIDEALLGELRRVAQPLRGRIDSDTMRKREREAFDALNLRG